MANKYSKNNKKLVQADKNQRTIKVKEGVLKICSESFDEAKATEVILPEGIVELEPDAFLRAKEIREINLPSTLKVIGDYAFRFCESLRKIEIPANVEYLGVGAFYGCGELEEVIINGTISWDKNWIKTNPPFGYLKSLKKIVSNNNNFIVFDDMLFSSDKTILFKCPTGKRSVNLPDELEYISDYAFYNCTFLDKVVIPPSVCYIGSSAFERCYSLREIRLPEALTRIENDTFALCWELAYVQFPNNLKGIIKNAFFGCNKLEFFYFPQNREQEIRDMLTESGYEPVVHSPLDYTEMASSLKSMMDAKAYDEIGKLLHDNCDLILLGKETISGAGQIAEFFKSIFSCGDNIKRVVDISTTLSEAYSRDCLEINIVSPSDRERWQLVFTLTDDKISLIVCGNIYIHASNSSKHPVGNILKCLKESPLTPEYNRMPCLECGLRSEQLNWLEYSVESKGGGYKGIMSFCPHCHEEIEFRETLHYSRTF